MELHTDKIPFHIFLESNIEDNHFAIEHSIEFRHDQIEYYLNNYYNDSNDLFQKLEMILTNKITQSMENYIGLEVTNNEHFYM